MERTYEELNFIQKKKEYLSFCVTLKNSEDDFPDFEIQQALELFAKNNPLSILTIYTYFSATFTGECSMSYIVAGVKSSGEHLVKFLSAFLKDLHDKISVRLEYSFLSDETLLTYHIEDGLAWRAEDILTYVSIDTENENYEEDESEIYSDLDDIDESLVEEIDEEEFDDFDTSNKDTTRGRKNAARSDAKLSGIARNIEKIYKLPSGCIAFVNPERKIFRKDALVKTLRKAWKN